jgi:hypothetical protein
LRYEQNPDWRRGLEQTVEPVVAAIDRDLNATIGRAVQQAKAEMAGQPANKIFEALCTRLRPELPEGAVESSGLATRLRQEAQRISDGTEYMLDEAGEPILDQAGNPMW